MKGKGLFLSALFCWCFGCTGDPESPERTLAGGQLLAVERTVIETDTYRRLSKPKGQVDVSEDNGIVSLTLRLSDFEPNSSHAVHLHNGSCENPGTHWNQNTNDSFCGRESLGFPWMRSKAGDIGNVTVDEQGNAIFSIQTDLWTLNTGLDSDIVGKVIVIHQFAEDLTSSCFILTAHDHAGNPKIACGDIQLRDD